MRFDDVKSIAWVIMQTETEVWILNEGDKVIQSFFLPPTIESQLVRYCVNKRNERNIKTKKTFGKHANGQSCVDDEIQYPWNAERFV